MICLNNSFVWGKCKNIKELFATDILFLIKTTTTTSNCPRTERALESNSPKKSSLLKEPNIHVWQILLIAKEGYLLWPYLPKTYRKASFILTFSLLPTIQNLF